MGRHLPGIGARLLHKYAEQIGLDPRLHDSRPRNSATAAIGGYRGSPRKREAQGWTVSFECGLARIAVMKALNRNGPREAAVGARSPVIGAKSQDTTRRFV